MGYLGCFLALVGCTLLAAEPPACSFEASSRLVKRGEAVVLVWACTQSIKVRLEPGSLVLDPKGQITVKPAGTTTYSLYEAKTGGELVGRVEIRVDAPSPLEPARVCSFTASSSKVLAGEPVVLRWDCTGDSKVRLEPGGLELDGKSEITVTPFESTRYVLTVTNLAGGNSRSLDVEVLKQPVLGDPAKVCTFVADRSSVRPGEAVRLRWECQGTAKVRLEPGNLELDGQDSITVEPSATTVYTLSVSNLAGGSSRSLEITVDEAPISVTDDQAFRKSLQEGLVREATRIGEARWEKVQARDWTLRLVVSGSAQGLKLLNKLSLEQSPKLIVLPYVRKDGFRWWQALWGSFPTRTQAEAAQRELPGDLMKALGKPQILRWDRIQKPVKAGP